MDIYEFLDKHPDGASMSVVTSAALTLDLQEVVKLRRSIYDELAKPLPPTIESVEYLVAEDYSRHNFLNMLSAIDAILAHRLADGRHDTETLIKEADSLHEELDADYGREVIMVDMAEIIEKMIAQ